MATAATVYMATVGAGGLERVAAACHANTRKLVDRLTAIDGVEQVFNRPVFHEAVLRLPADVNDVLRKLATQDLLGGYAVMRDYPDLENCVLVCATETRSDEDLDIYAAQLAKILGK